MYQMATMYILTQLHIDNLGSIMWGSQNIANGTLTIGSMSMYLLQYFNSAGMIPPWLFYYWNEANLYNQKYGSKVTAMWGMFNLFANDPTFANGIRMTYYVG